MKFFDSLKKLGEQITLPSAAELEAFNFEASSPYPEFAAVSAHGEQPTISMSWLKNLFGKEASMSEKQMMPISQDSTPRESSDVESQASSDVSTLLETEKVPEKREQTAAAAARVVSDAIIGLSDGLTVPFALTAGLSALGDTRLVIYAGMAELIAGAISMGLGGYLGAKSEEYVEWTGFVFETSY